VSADSGEEGARYWAFVSYSHKDAAFGRRLHRRLESYVVPPRLVGRATAEGPVPRRIAPIFRDREEFAAATNLSAEVRAALQASRSLVVVCSPAAAASQWVTREVELFRSLHPDRPVLAAIRDGEPAFSFPQALRRNAQGEEIVEPLAADFRKGRDGAELGVLKLVAGILGLGLDELVQRDAQRRTRRVTAVTAGALVGMLAMGLLTIFAFYERHEARQQRSGAEGLTQFMLTDLRDKLSEVGRLDVLSAVNARALKYYDDQGMTSLPTQSLERRAQILDYIGSDQIDRNHFDKAQTVIHEAYDTTSQLLSAAPNDPDRIYQQAQSDYWTGYFYFQSNRYPTAKYFFEAYKRLADRLTQIEPRNARFLREVAYAEGDICSADLRPPIDAKGALSECLDALHKMQLVAHDAQGLYGVAADIENRHSWLVSAYLENRDRKDAWAEGQVQDRQLQSMMKVDPENLKLRSKWIALQRLLAWMESKDGNIQGALARLGTAASVSDQLVAFDPSNQTWAQQRIKLDGDIKRISTMNSERK
jgi:hypothetical protein